MMGSIGLLEKEQRKYCKRNFDGVIMKIIYRPHRGNLIESMEESCVFDTFESLQEHVCEQFPKWFRIRPCEIVKSGDPICCKHKDVCKYTTYLCVDSYRNIQDKNGYERYFGAKYEYPQCIGIVDWFDELTT